MPPFNPSSLEKPLPVNSSYIQELKLNQKSIMRKTTIIPSLNRQDKRQNKSQDSKGLPTLGRGDE